MKYCIIAIIIICLLLLISEINYFLLDKSKFGIKSVNDIKFRTGDLIFSKAFNGSVLTYDSINKKNNFYYKNILSSKYNLMRLLIGFYTHVSVIICINDIPYVYELNVNPEEVDRYCNYFNIVRNIEEPVLLNMDYLERYEGHCYHYKYKGDTIHYPENFIELYKNKKLINRYAYLEAYDDYRKNRNISDTTYVTCCAAVADFLKYNNIINNNHSSIMFTTKSLFNATIYGTSNYEITPTLIKNHYSIYEQ
jgi:hypothetical protein